MAQGDFYPNNTAGNKLGQVATNLPISQGDGANFPNSIQILPTFSSVIIDQFRNGFKFRSLFKTEAELNYINGRGDALMIPKVTVNGIYDYKRGAVAEGYTDASVRTAYESAVWGYLRGGSVAVDTLDYENSVLSKMQLVPIYFTELERATNTPTLVPPAVGRETATLIREYIRTELADDLSIYVVSELSAKAGTVVTNEDLSTTQEILDALASAANTMAENSVPTEERILYITPTLLRLAKSGDLLTNTRVLDEFSEVIEVPQDKMYTLAEKTKVQNLPDGKYKPSANSKEINFLVVSKHSTIVAAEFRDFAFSNPDTNVAAYKTAFRVRAIAHVYGTRKQGVYVSSSSKTATAPIQYKVGGDDETYEVKVIDRSTQPIEKTVAKGKKVATDEK